MRFSKGVIGFEYLPVSIFNLWLLILILDMDSDNENQNENVDDIFDELKDIKKKHPNKFICSYININSFRNKFGFIKDLSIKSTNDPFFIFYDYFCENGFYNLTFQFVLSVTW
jgi:hypothetical protein